MAATERSRRLNPTVQKIAVIVAFVYGILMFADHSLGLAFAVFCLLFAIRPPRPLGFDENTSILNLGWSD